MEPQRKSRQIRRHTVSAQTISTISGDTWLLVCSNLFFSPASVLKLMQTSKTIWLALKNDPAWWQRFFDRVILYQSVLTKSNCLGVLKELGDKSKNNKRAVIHLVFSSECGKCGARFGHSIFKPLMKRMCQTCIHDSLVSNRVLLHKYGIHFSDMVMEYCGKGGVLMVHGQPKPTLSSFLRVTADTLDITHHTCVPKYGSPPGNKMLFFDKAFISEVMGINLTEEYAKNLQKKAAVMTLMACLRRLKTQSLLFHASKYHMIMGMEAARKHEIQRLLHSFKACSVWITGGPYYSFSAHPSAIKHDDGRLPIKPRNGMTCEKIARIVHCVNQWGVSLE
jgi:hypothetical protein